MRPTFREDSRQLNILSRCRICGLKRWQGMANSSTSPIIVCANFIFFGGSYAQVHFRPDTRPSLPLRQRLLKLKSYFGPPP